MAIFLQIDGIPGSVTANGLDGWIQLTKAKINTRRAVTRRIGQKNTYHIGDNHHSGFFIEKEIDKSSSKLFAASHTAKLYKAANIKFCTGDNGSDCYLEYNLKNVLITDHSVHAEHDLDKKGSLEKPLASTEMFTIHFTQIQMKNSYKNKDGSTAGQAIAAHNISTKKTS